MKGVFIYQQVEYRLEVAKQEFFQGDSLPCVLTIKNHSDNTQQLNQIRLCLALADIKKAKEKSADAFEVISSAPIEFPLQIAAKEQLSFSWTCTLDRNCPLSDKSQSLCFLYGPTTCLDGQLPIQVQAHAHLQEVPRILETTYQFVLKGQKSSKGWVEAKLKPSSSKQFATVNELILGMRFEEDSVLLRYRFSLKKFDVSADAVGGVLKAKSEFEQRLEKDQYLLPGGFINHPSIEASIEKALKQVASGF